MINRSKCLGVLVFIVLNGCGKQNPLLTDHMVTAMQDHFIWNSKNYPIRKCAQFYAGDCKMQDKALCEAWTQEYYTSLYKNDNLPKGTTLENFRDKAFWKRVVKDQ